MQTYSNLQNLGRFELITFCKYFQLGIILKYSNPYNFWRVWGYKILEPFSTSKNLKIFEPPKFRNSSNLYNFGRFLTYKIFESFWTYEDLKIFELIKCWELFGLIKFWKILNLYNFGNILDIQILEIFGPIKFRRMNSETEIVRVSGEENHVKVSTRLVSAPRPWTLKDLQGSKRVTEKWSELMCVE